MSLHIIIATGRKVAAWSWRFLLNHCHELHWIAGHQDVKHWVCSWFLTGVSHLCPTPPSMPSIVALLITTTGANAMDNSNKRSSRTVLPFNILPPWTHCLPRWLTTSDSGRIYLRHAKGKIALSPVSPPPFSGSFLRNRTHWISMW